MSKNYTLLLHQKIEKAKQQQRVEGQELLEQVLETYESLRLVNIIKNTIHNLAESKEAQDDALKIIFNNINILVGRILGTFFKTTEETPLKNIIVGYIHSFISGMISKFLSFIKG